ncbi:MAG: SDR family NAD(P)-dependent oxidoreductase [Candidatus Binataceae bacterium]|jgi:NAD(P)-dependent dehydrogenase (short-subunit alcohol dehydrogenase family)
MASEKNPAGKQRLLGKVAIVTGAGRGIGRAEAMLLAREGAKVVVNDIGGTSQGEGVDKSVADAVVKEIRDAGGEAIVNCDSVATMEGGGRIVKTALDAFGRLDILINNAGNARPRVIYNLTEEDWDSVIAVHLKGHFTTIRYAAPIFREQRSGVIVNTGSESGLGHLGQSNYSAAKEGIIGLTRTIARDLGRFNVRCNAIRPRAATRLATEEVMQAMLKTQEVLGGPALGKSTIDRATFLENKPEQVAALAVWLCTDAAANVNGRDFQVGGDEVGLYSEPEVIRGLFRDGGWDLDSLDKVATRDLIGGLRNEFLGAGKR